MAMRVPGIGSQYLWTIVDANKQPFDGAKTYKVTLPKDIPEANFWSFTLYDNQTRSMLDTPQRYPRAGSQSYPSPAAEANADGTTTVYFGPTQPAGRQTGQLDPDHARQRFYPVPAPLRPARTVLHQGMAAERDRIGSVSRGQRTRGCPVCAGHTHLSRVNSQESSDENDHHQPHGTGEQPSAMPRLGAHHVSRRETIASPGALMWAPVQIMWAGNLDENQ